MGKFIDRTGVRYGILKVIERVDCGPASKGKRVRWLCRCDCGAVKSVTGHELASGDTTSCGCVKKAKTGAINRTHGLTRTGTYNSWRAAKARCHDPNNAKFYMYGAVGIAMCDRWRNDFSAFYEDMGPRPEGYSIDRIDQTKGYEPGNCQWATSAEQCLTRGSTRLYRWAGTWLTTKEIAEREGVAFNTLRKIVKHHRTIQAAVSEAKAKRRGHV